MLTQFAGLSLLSSFYVCPSQSPDGTKKEFLSTRAPNANWKGFGGELPIGMLPKVQEERASKEEEEEE